MKAMNAMKEMEMIKSAKLQLDERQRKELAKYLRWALGAGVLSAGIGTYASGVKSDDKRRKAIDPHKSKSAIIVDIDKSNFTKGLPTPEEHRRMFGGETDAVAKTDISGMDKKDIDSLKREISRKSERRFDFFGTKAAVDGSGSPEPDKAKPEGGKDDVPEKGGDKKTDLPRDDAGRFVSPTSPIGVMKAEEEREKRDNGDGGNGQDSGSNEKTAKDDGWNLDWADSTWKAIAHPGKTMKAFIQSGAFVPTAISAGGVGAIYLSAMIVDRVNKMRAQNSMKNAERARNRYVNILQGGGEKTAQEEGYGPRENINSLTGAVIGSSFIIPAVAMWMVTNKIMEMRKREKEEAKDRSSSIPDDRFVLYRTVDGKDMRIRPEAALAAASIKQAMFMDFVMEKKAEDSVNLFSRAVDKIKEEFVPKDAYEANDTGYGNAVNEIYGIISDEKNKDKLLDIAKAYDPENPNTRLAREKMLEMIPKDRLGMFAKLDPNELQRRVTTDKRVGDLFTSYLNDGSHPGWNQLVEDRTNRMIVNNGWARGGSLWFRFLSWLMNGLGLRRMFTRNYVNKALSGMAPQPSTVSNAKT